MASRSLRSRPSWGAVLAAASLASLLACAPASAPPKAAPASAASRASSAPLSPFSAPAAAPPLPAPYAAHGAFAGVWQSHAFTLAVDAEGTGVAAWRTYRWCDTALPPCDLMSGNHIAPGGRATLLIQHTADHSAAANVIDTTDPRSIPLGPALLVLVRDGRLRLVVGSPGAPRLPVELCLAGTARSTDCGA